MKIEIDVCLKIEAQDARDHGEVSKDLFSVLELGLRDLLAEVGLEPRKIRDQDGIEFEDPMAVMIRTTMGY